MRDSDIRAALHTLLQARHGDDPDTLIRHELGLCAGKRRIDVAIVNGEFAGYEIKSDEDTLSRLAGQAAAYARVLDRVVLVTTKRHVEDAESALPAWWGIMMAASEQTSVGLEMVREPALNDRHDAFALAQLLWRDEALDELRLRGEAHGLAKKARYYLWTALAELVTIEELRDIVRARLKARQEWPGGQPRASYGETLRRTATA